MLDVVKRVSGVPYQFGGELHSGWLPAGAAIPVPTPIHNVLLDVEIQFDGHGYLLCYSAQEGSLSGDSWHQSLEESELAAEEYFGIAPWQWQSA